MEPSIDSLRKHPDLLAVIALGLLLGVAGPCGRVQTWFKPFQTAPQTLQKSWPGAARFVFAGRVWETVCENAENVASDFANLACAKH